MERSKLILAHIAPLIGLAAAFYWMKSHKKPSFVALIGDVGGTNIRLSLRRLCLKTRTSTEVK